MTISQGKLFTGLDFELFRNPSYTSIESTLGPGIWISNQFTDAPVWHSPTSAWLSD